MLTNKMMHDSQMLNMLSKVVESFQAQGVVCEITSPKSLSFSSTLPPARVKEVFEACSLPLKPTIQTLESAAGCHGSVEVLGLTRADE